MNAQRTARNTKDLAVAVLLLSCAVVILTALHSGCSIAAISDLTVRDNAADTPSATGPDGGSSTQGTRSESRSNESLLSVVRRYAPGIRFCYDNELKKNPNLRGKLVISITVLASGQVSEAFVVEDSLRSPAVTQCVLSQIRGWQLPAIPHGVITFKTPFVFTPPK
jgi:TonB family protein